MTSPLVVAIYKTCADFEETGLNFEIERPATLKEKSRTGSNAQPFIGKLLIMNYDFYMVYGYCFRKPISHYCVWEIGLIVVLLDESFGSLLPTESYLDFYYLSVTTHRGVRSRPAMRKKIALLLWGYHQGRCSPCHMKNSYIFFFFGKSDSCGKYPARTNAPPPPTVTVRVGLTWRNL